MLKGVEHLEEESVFLTQDREPQPAPFFQFRAMEEKCRLREWYVVRHVLPDAHMQFDHGSGLDFVGTIEWGGNPLQGTFEGKFLRSGAAPSFVSQFQEHILGGAQRLPGNQVVKITLGSQVRIAAKLWPQRKSFDHNILNARLVELFVDASRLVKEMVNPASVVSKIPLKTC
jgi:hypothetical protein